MKTYIELYNTKGEVYCTINYDKIKRLTICSWVGEYHPWEIRRAYKKLLLFFQEKENKGHYIRFISDDRKSTPNCRDEAKNWVSHIFIPLIVEQGVKHVAFVNNDDFMNSLLKK